jgi:hypothetical protein
VAFFSTCCSDWTCGYMFHVALALNLVWYAYMFQPHLHLVVWHNMFLRHFIVLLWCFAEFIEMNFTHLIYIYIYIFTE